MAEMGLKEKCMKKVFFNISETLSKHFGSNA